MRLLVLIFFLLFITNNSSKAQTTLFQAISEIETSNFQLNGPIIKKSEDNRYSGHIMLSGTFDQTSYKKLKTVLDGHKTKRIYIYANSQGGIFSDRETIITLMKLIHSYDNIIWISNGRCVSACAVIGASAKSTSGILTFHSTLLISNQGKKIIMDKETNNKILNLLVSYGLNKEVFEKVLFSNKDTSIKF